MIFDEIESAINIWGKLKNRYNSRKSVVETVSARFVKLFESHGVHRNQIPRFFDHGLTLKDVQDDVSLISKLNENILEDVCKLFAVRREWLDGADTKIYPEHDFYKHPEKFLIFINDLKTTNPDGYLDGVLFAPDVTDHDAEAILVLYEVVGSVGNEPMHRYHLCNNWLFSYWKARGYLAACIAIAWKSSVYVRGNIVTKKSINKLAHGEVLLGDQQAGVENLHGKIWHPEDMALNPDVYLNGVDPELNNYGIRAGLELWLELEKQDLMNAGIDKSGRELFSNKLEEYKSS